LRSDVPTDNDKGTRDAIAEMMERLENPEREKLARERAKLDVLKWELAEGERRGETEKQTLKRIAPWFGRAAGWSMRKSKEKSKGREGPASWKNDAQPRKLAQTGQGPTLHFQWQTASLQARLVSPMA